MLRTIVNWIFLCCTLQTTQLDIESSSEEEVVRRDDSHDDTSDTDLNDYEVTKKKKQTRVSSDDDGEEETANVFRIDKEGMPRSSFKEVLLRKNKKVAVF